MGIIRFLLAISVLIAHAGSAFGFDLLPGYLAVQCFYIVSGFYIAFIYCEKYAKTDRPLYFFYTNRFLRLYPLYFLVVVLTLLLSVLCGLIVGSYWKLEYFFDTYRNNPDTLNALLIIGMSDLLLVGQDVITFLSLGSDSTLHVESLRHSPTLQSLLIIPIAWTVSIEIFFYAVAPLVVTRKVATVVGVILLVVALRVFLFFVFQVEGGFSIYRFAPTEFFWFCLGILSYKLSQKQILPGKQYGVAMWIALLLAIVSYSLYEMEWILLVLIAIGTPPIFYRFSSFSYDRYLGELTYPIYISHCLFYLIVVTNHFPKYLGTGWPMLIMTLVFSVACYHYFLKPIERIRMLRIADGHRTV